MAHLNVLQPAPPPTPPRNSRWKPIATRVYRLAVIVAIVWLVHVNATRNRVRGDAPIKPEEVRALLPTAAKLEVDPSELRGLFVLDAAGNRVGYALRTSPDADGVKGYVGSTDTLIVLDPSMKVVGISIRSSHDTKDHVFEKIVPNPTFMELYNGMTWDEVASQEIRVGYDEVEGASLSSRAIKEGVRLRFRTAKEAAAAPPPAFRFGWHDAGLSAVIIVACLFSFTGLRSKTWARRAFQVVLIVYVGYFNGQILSQSLMAGWSAGGAAWRTATGLALLLAAALIVPWATRRQLYCSQICPHGAAQELIGRAVKWRLRVPKGVDAGLRWLPPMLIGLVLLVTMLELPLDLAGIEPFVAYQLSPIVWASIWIAIAGLLLAAFVPMAYCKYGCPTGLVLSFVRSHGKADGFGRRDLSAGILVLLALTLYLKHDLIMSWIRG